MKQEWFAHWFDSPYYHTLYKNRDEDEAQKFIKNLTEKIQLPKGSRVLDLACGKGRHAITLNQLGYNVIGADLSQNSIDFAKQFENDTLHFRVHDMREVMPDVQFDAVFNLFTSFGYFSTLAENDTVITSIAKMVKSKGLLVIDFMNSVKVINHLVKDEVKVVDGISFHIQRSHENEKIVKSIQFEAEGQQFDFKEQVQAITLTDFERLLSAHNFKIISTFGDFNLGVFDLQKSNRLIIIAQRD